MQGLCRKTRGVSKIMALMETSRHWADRAWRETGTGWDGLKLPWKIGVKGHSQTLRESDSNCHWRCQGRELWLGTECFFSKDIITSYKHLIKLLITLQSYCISSSVTMGGSNEESEVSWMLYLFRFALDLHWVLLGW